LDELLIGAGGAFFVEKLFDLNDLRWLYYILLAKQHEFWIVRETYYGIFL